MTARRASLGRARALAAALIAFGLGAPAGQAQAQVPYVPSPPTPGALYRDGQSGRYLLGGEWLYRADPADAGLSSGWAQDPSTDSWTPTTVPNAFNAGDFSTPSMLGAVGWYRRDFTLPAGTFARSEERRVGKRSTAGWAV